MSEQQHLSFGDAQPPLSEDFADCRVAELERVWRRMALDLGYCSEQSQPALLSQRGV